ncbi:hypothetical protein [Actinopolymorpha alba]|uniref:hypothetical protein n=1 Tax=Actinopolymorpha alba TaxID=533267 RepID=UPI0003601173|nr:hypothetical protein [Actinopolymorpha alba]
MLIPGWSPAAASTWRRARPPRWADPRFSAVGWALILVLLVATDVTPPCSDAAPCPRPGADVLVESLIFALAFAHIAWVGWLPAMTWVTTPLILVSAVLWPDEFVGNSARWVLALVPLAAVWTLGTLFVRHVGRRRQLEAAATVATAVPALPKPLPPRARWPLRLVAGCAAVLASLAVLAYAVQQHQSDADHARRARPVTATVVAHKDDGFVVRVRWPQPGPDGRDLEAWDATGYPVGSTTTVLVDETWARLAAEPYDASGWGALSTGLALLGFTLIGDEVAWRRQLAAFVRGSVPALRVWICPSDDGDVLVFPSADRAEPALLRVSLDAVNPDEEDDENAGDEWDDDEDDPEEDEESEEYFNQRDSAVLYGLPYDGAVLAAQIDDDEDELFLVPHGRARPPKARDRRARSER